MICCTLSRFPSERRYSLVTACVVDHTRPDEKVSGIVNHRFEEMEGLRDHGIEYAGKWVALEGRLISSGNAKEVRDEAREMGVVQPLVVRVPEAPDRITAGW